MLNTVRSAETLAADILAVCEDVSDALFVESAARRARTGYDERLPRAIDTSVYGIEYARQTCRVSGVVEMAIRRLSREGMARLIADIVTAELTVGDIARFLNARFA